MLNLFYTKLKPIQRKPLLRAAELEVPPPQLQLSQVKFATVEKNVGSTAAAGGLYHSTASKLRTVFRPTTCWHWTKRSPGLQTKIRSKPAWWSCGSSLDSRSKRRLAASASPALRPTATGPTPGLGSMTRCVRTRI